jgi:hypothetical protein
MNTGIYEYVMPAMMVLWWIVDCIIALIALIVAIHLTRKKQCRAAAWLLFTASGLLVFMDFLFVVNDIILVRALDYTVTSWIDAGLSLINLAPWTLFAFALALFRAPKAAAGQPQEAGHV